MTDLKTYSNLLEKDLRERVKELECLYEIAKLNIKNVNKPLGETLNAMLKIIQQAWQYPEITEVKIRTKNNDFITKDFTKGIDSQQSKIKVNGETRGFLEVCYTEKKPQLVEGPFLAEERSLIDKLAMEISNIIERFEILEEKKHLEQKLRHSDRLATLGELIAGIAHELNEPLGSILGFAELIQEDNKKNEQLQDDVKKIINASIHSREVIRKLMMFSKFDEKDVTLMNINEIISGGLYVLEHRCKKENIQIIKLLDKDLPNIYANMVQINQVIVNLIVNAIHAMPNGGHLILQTRFDKQFIYIIVQDNGNGIAENYIKKIFNPFFTTKESEMNTGLGLSVVHGIIESYNGNIEVESHLGTGTRFEISLPITSEPC